MNIKFFISVVCFCLAALSLSSQTISVLSPENEPLVGASIQLSNKNGIVFSGSANQKGKFETPAYDYASSGVLFLEVSYIGFVSVIDTLNNNENKKYKLKAQIFGQDEVVITAQYSPTNPENSVHKIRIIDKEKMESMAAVNLKDVLSNELNIRVEQDNVLGAGISMQGVSGQNVKILVDGVPVVGRLDGQIDLGQINLNNVERIEIVEGPLSVNYGSNALAGTINIITNKKAKEKFGMSLDSYNENIGTFNYGISTSFRLKKRSNFRLSYGRNFFDGWNPNDKFFPSFSKEKADSNRVKQWNAKLQHFGRLQYNYQLENVTLGAKSEYFTEKVTNRGLPRVAGVNITALDDIYKTQRFDNSIFANGKIKESKNFQFVAAYNSFKRVKEARIKNLIDLTSKLIPETANNDLQDTSSFHLVMSRASLSTSNDSSILNYELGYDLSWENADGERIAGNGQELGDFAIFSSAEIKPYKGLVIKPAVRAAHNTKYSAPLTPSLNVKYSFSNITFRVSYAQGFRAPSLKELYFDFNDVNHSLFGNTNLKAEKSNNYTFATTLKREIKKGVLQADFSLFYNDINNLIDLAQIQNTGDTLRYINVGKNQTKGINTKFNWKQSQWRAGLGFSYIGRYNQINEFEKSKLFTYASELVGNVSYLFDKKNITIAMFFKHQGELPAFGLDENNKVEKQTIEDYQIVDMSITKTLWDKKFKLTFGCKNIANVQSVRANLSSGAHSGGANSISVGTGRTYFLRFNYNFIKR